MSNYILSCSSTSDLSSDYYDKKNIKYINFHFTLDGQDYADDFGNTIPFEEFYDRMAHGEETHTTSISVEEFLEYFKSFLEQGLDILHVSLSSGISNVYNCACRARDKLKIEYPERKIYIVDSLGASSGYGMLMDILAEKRDEGLSLEEIKEEALKLRYTIHHWFFSSDLEYYVKGGRISRFSGFIASLFKLCPLLRMDKKGHLTTKEKIRTKENAIVEIVHKMEENALDGINYSGKCFISHSNCLDDALEVRDLLEAKFLNLKNKIKIYSIGTTIGSHTGPGTVALFFQGNKRN